VADWNVGGLGDEEAIIVRAQLVGAGEFVAEADAITGATEEMGVAAETTGRKMEGASRRSFLMGQAMFTMRRFLYQGTLGLVAAGGAAVYFGLQFDSNMQQSTIALTHFLGGTKAAKTELNSLFRLAAYTPFSFADVTEAAKSMLSFGFSVKQTNDYLRVMADTMSGLGLSGQAVQQFTNDIVKMSARGKIMGQDIRELVSLHIPALAILQKQLGLTEKQVQNIGNANIPATVAIDALMRGLEERYRGMSERQSRSLLGRFSTIKDLTQQMLGEAMRPLFIWLQQVALPVVITIINALYKGFGIGGLLGSLRALNRSGAPFWFKTLYTFVVRTAETVQNLYDTFKPLILILGGGLLIALYLVNTALGIFNRLGVVGQSILWGLVAAYVALNIETWIATLRSLYLLVTTALYVTVLDLYEASIWLVVAAMYAWDFVTNLLTISMGLLDAELWGNPIGLIVLAVLALAVGIYLLWTRSKTFRDIIKSIGGIALSVFGYIARTIEYIVDKIEWLARKIESIPGFHLAMEIGASLIDSGANAVHQTAGQAAAGRFVGMYNETHGGGSGVPTIVVHSHLHVDRKVLGQAVAKYESDQKAKQ
jgi:tape measure domain-containing protein